MSPAMCGFVARRKTMGERDALWEAGKTPACHHVLVPVTLMTGETVRAICEKCLAEAPLP
jgi:hypothetical protein